MSPGMSQTVLVSLLSVQLKDASLPGIKVAFGARGCPLLQPVGRVQCWVTLCGQHNTWKIPGPSQVLFLLVCSLSQ